MTTLATLNPAGAMRETSESVKRTHIVELLFGFSLTVDGMAIPGLGFPYSLAGLALLIVYGYSRKPKYSLGQYSWVPWVLALAVCYVSIVSFMSYSSDDHMTWVKRLIRIAEILIFVLLMATERIHLRSLIKGISLGLVLNVFAFNAGLAPDTYQGALTGWVGDKNRAGMYYAVVGVLMLWFGRNNIAKFILFVGFGAGVWLTESRTAMAAYAISLLWMVFVARRTAVTKWVAGGAAWALFQILETNYAQVGQFANRAGSDWLRHEIELATAAKLGTTPFWGAGLGEAVVVIGRNTWYFHNGYDTLLVEGGVIYLALILGVTVFIGIRPFEMRCTSVQGNAAQAAALIILLCATKLGEVFLSFSWALVAGIALNYALSIVQVRDCVGGYDMNEVGS